MIWIFGIGIPEGLFYAMIVAGVIFYSFSIWLILQIMRRKMPIRINKAGLGQSLEEYRGKEDDIRKAAEAAGAACAPISDVRASEGYRRDMVEVVTRRVLEEVLS